jgi:hypothetical protein
MFPVFREARFAEDFFTFPIVWPCSGSIAFLRAFHGGMRGAEDNRVASSLARDGR